jgi:ATP-dependent DNA ligase
VDCHPRCDAEGRGLINAYGGAVVLGLDGISDFAALYSRRHDDEVQFYAFDMLAGDGDDMRSLPLSLRKTDLARLLAHRSDGI